MPNKHEQNGRDAIAAGIDQHHGWDSSRGPRPDFQQNIDATTQAQPGSLAEAIEEAGGFEKLNIRPVEPEPMDPASPVDVYGNRKHGAAALAAGLEASFRKDENR